MIKKTLKIGLELLIVIAIFTVISQWLSRHLLESGTQVSDFSLPTLNSEAPTDLNWPSVEEKTLIYFFALWCSVCRISMPSLNTLPEGEQLRVVAIALDYETEEEVSHFISDIGFEQEVLLGNSYISQQFKIQGYPSYYVINQKGEVIHKDRGISTPPGLWLRTQI